MVKAFRRGGRLRRLLLRSLVVGLAVFVSVQPSVGADSASAPSAPATVQVQDARGHIVRLPQPARRIVSLLPSLTETVCALDACERLVATDRWSDWPTSVRALPKAGGLDDANIELIVSLRPDLVLAARSTRVAERLEALGIPVAVFEAQNLTELRGVYAAVGHLLGRGDGEARWQALHKEIQAAADALPQAARGLRVYFEVETSPYAAGAASFIGETLAALGARNIVPPELGPFPKLNPEFIVRADPDLIIVVASHADELARRPGWSSLRALRGAGQGGVCAVPAADYDTLVRPGPRMGQAARVMAQCLARAASRP